MTQHRIGRSRESWASIRRVIWRNGSWFGCLHSMEGNGTIFHGMDSVRWASVKCGMESVLGEMESLFKGMESVQRNIAEPDGDFAWPFCILQVNSAFCVFFFKFHILQILSIYVEVCLSRVLLYAESAECDSFHFAQYRHPADNQLEGLLMLSYRPCKWLPCKWLHLEFGY